MFSPVIQEDLFHFAPFGFLKFPFGAKTFQRKRKNSKNLLLFLKSFVIIIRLIEGNPGKHVGS